MATNRKQRRSAKKVHADQDIADYAKMVRGWSDRKIYDELHGPVKPEVVDQVVKDMFEDIIATLAPKFDDEVMDVVAKTLHDWYHTPEEITLVESTSQEMSETLQPSNTPTACVKGGIYRHFKGNFYKLVDRYLDSERLCGVILYHSVHNLNGNPRYFVRSKENFFEELDELTQAKYGQKHRFEYYK